jgi:Uma2 family endonuclease
MAGGSPNHNSIALDVVSNLRIGLRRSDCRAFGSETRLLIKANGLYTYPDAMVVCGQIERTDDKRETLTNPTVIVEVLSSSTEGYDRGLKFERYRAIETFREYVLLHQDRPFIEQYLKGADNVWTVRFIHGLESTLLLQTIDYALPLQLIYNYVTWPDKDNR